MSDLNYTVRYAGTIPSSGDYTRYRFSVLGPDKKETDLFVRVSGSLTGGKQSDESHWPKVAARAVEYHLQNKIEPENYKDGEILVTTYWQPEEPLQEFEAFEVPLLKPPMGFPGIK